MPPIQQIMIAQKAAVVTGSVTFDPSKKGAYALLSGGNNNLGSSSATAQALATAGYSTGKYYFEVLCSGAVNSRSVGISRTGGAVDYDSDLGQEAGEYGWYSNGNSYFAG
ncbi:MAG: hypothetical protein ACTS6J_16970, partial [Burkholderiales bacterium]